MKRETCSSLPERRVCLCGGRPAHKQAGVRAAAARSQECLSHRFKDSSRDMLTKSFTCRPTQ